MKKKIFYKIFTFLIFFSSIINTNAKNNFNDTTNIEKAKDKTPSYITDIIVDSHLYDSLKSDTTHRYYYSILDSTNFFTNLNRTIPDKHDFNKTEFVGQSLFVLLSNKGACRRFNIKLISDGKIDERGLLHITTLVYDYKLRNNFVASGLVKEANISKLKLDMTKLKGIALHSFEINYYRELNKK